MTNSENLRFVLRSVQETGKFEKHNILAVLSNMIDIADRLERVEIKCEIEPTDRPDSEGINP